MRLHAFESGGGRETLVVLHGLFGSASNLGVVARRFAARFRVLAMDARNHGASPHAPGMAYERLAEDVAETLAAHGVERAWVAGHSMGGKIAMRLALDRPELVAGLAVLDIAPAPYPSAFRSFAAAMRALPLRSGLTRADADAALAPAIPDAGVRGFLLQNLRLAPQPHWRIGLAEIAEGLPEIEAWREGGRYDGPCAFVRGAESDYVRPRHAEAMHDAFPAHRLTEIPDAGHWLHADNPAGVLAALEDFLP